MVVRDGENRAGLRYTGLINATLAIGGSGGAGMVRIHDAEDALRIHLDGKEGDVKLLGADFAEDFDLENLDGVEPGTVMVIGEAGRLAPCTAAYDRRVAGVLSGAGNCRPGMILDRQAATERRRPLALIGKVFCKAEAFSAPITMGDLLTTSAVPGHAMKADDPLRAIGAIMGKALRPLPTSTGLIPILVALQ